LCDYSMVDAELALALSDRLLPLEMEMASVAKMPLFETALSTSGQLVENLLMYHAAERNELIPSRPGGDEIGERINAPIQGAFVKLPEPGIYENVAVLDFRGLYPSIIVSYNIDPGTLIAEGKHAQHGKSGDVFVSPTGALFSKQEIGLIPFVLDYLIDMRMKLKKALKTTKKDTEEYVKLGARSQALKILANSFYGYMGYARSRWYSRPCAESVTAWGRKHITETIETAEKAGFTVLYADTDSVFLLYKNREDVIKFMNSVNAALPPKMELELEGFYPRGVFVSKKGGEERGAKKKYALLGEDGRIKIRGFELVRRDWSMIAKETQLKVLEAILKEGSKEKAVKIIRDVVARLQEGKVPLEMLAISTQLNKDPKSYEVASPELSAAKKMLKAGIPAEKGTVISYVVSRNGKSISEKAEPLELAKDYDADYYINNQVLPAVMKIMKELGYDEYSMKFGGKQKSLEHFF
ncbi:MAG: DNA polymerase domain-containing protein, partial [Candidatus ainarchaeum sp.]|nr:DNA polymerase domain-containing protein [Candidatus ainarchaeum sp.]